jgi:hypothetical protein
VILGRLIITTLGISLGRIVGRNEEWDDDYDGGGGLEMDIWT